MQRHGLVLGLLLSLALLWATPARAATVLFSLPDITRSGTQTTPSVTIPISNKTLILQIVSATWLTTPGVTVTVLVEQSLDGGVTWQPWAGFTAVTGANRGSVLPSLVLTEPNMVNRTRLGRLKATFSAPFSCGITGTVQ